MIDEGLDCNVLEKKNEYKTSISSIKEEMEMNTKLIKELQHQIDSGVEVKEEVKEDGE